MFHIGKEQTAHVSELLSAYVDNQLNRTDRLRVEDHLRTCALCTQDLRLLQSTVQALRAMPVVPVPRSFILQPAIQPRPVARLPFLALRLATAATAAALLVAIGGDVLLRGYTPVAAPAPQTFQQTAAAPTSAAGPSQKSAAEPSGRAQRDASTATPSGAPASAAAPAAPAAAAGAPTAVAAAAENLGAAPTPTPAPAAALAAPVLPLQQPQAAIIASPTAPPHATQTDSSAVGAPSRPPSAAAAATIAPTATVAPGPPSPAGAALPATTGARQDTPTAEEPAAQSQPASAAAPAAAGSPLRPVEVGLAGLLAVLIAATVFVGRRQH